MVSDIESRIDLELLGDVDINTKLGRDTIKEFCSNIGFDYSEMCKLLRKYDVKTAIDMALRSTKNVFSTNAKSYDTRDIHEDYILKYSRRFGVKIGDLSKYTDEEIINTVRIIENKIKRHNNEIDKCKHISKELFKIIWIGDEQTGRYGADFILGYILQLNKHYRLNESQILNLIIQCKDKKSMVKRYNNIINIYNQSRRKHKGHRAFDAAEKYLGMFGWEGIEISLESFERIYNQKETLSKAVNIIRKIFTANLIERLGYGYILSFLGIYIENLNTMTNNIDKAIAFTDRLHTEYSEYKNIGYITYKYVVYYILRECKINSDLARDIIKNIPYINIDYGYFIMNSILKCKLNMEAAVSIQSIVPGELENYHVLYNIDLDISHINNSRLQRVIIQYLIQIISKYKENVETV